MIRTALPEPVRRRIWNAVVDHPTLSRAYFYLDPDVRSLRLTRDTDLVVDGYMRSANTYAVCALQYAHGPGLRLVHHLHRPGVIRRAASIGVPALVTVRPPEQVLASLLHFDSSTDPKAVLDTFALFYEQLLPVVDRLVVARFGELVTDFGEVTRWVNARFGTEFAIYEKTSESEAAVRAAVEHFSRAYFAGDHFEQRVSRPSSERRSGDDIVSTLDRQQLLSLARAREVGEELVARRWQPVEPHL